jgi:hypothetical protein
MADADGVRSNYSMNNYPQDNMPSSGPAPVSPMGIDKVRVPMGNLPKGTKSGDVIEMMVSDIDPGTNMAYLTTQKSGGKPTDATANTGMTDEEEDAKDDFTPDKGDEQPLNTSVLLGPMSGLKNYLAQKASDQPKNVGRTQ